jgi:hypothetical protein
MFGEADAINSLRQDLIRTIRESSALTSSTTNKLAADLVFAIMDSALTRDENLRLLTKSIDGLNSTIKRVFFKPPNPGPLRITATGELQMANMLGFKIVLPELPPEPNDIVSGELTVSIGTGEAQVIPTTKEQTEIVGLSGEQGAEVNVSFVYVDDAGNRSEEASSLLETLVDTIPPATPGALGLAVTSEFTTEDPSPSIAPEEPPV